jgi:3-dehydroquinate dehydratase-1
MPACKPLSLRGRLLGAEKTPLVCVPLVGRNAAQLLDELARVHLAGPDLIEWRADFLEGVPDVAQCLAIARQLQAAAGDLPLVFTWRTAAEGGQPTSLDASGVCQISAAMAASGLFALIDLESALDASLREPIVQAARRTGTAIILSRHDFATTPSIATMLEWFALAQQLGADVAKLAVMPQQDEDVLSLLAATAQASQTLRIPLISMAMGSRGTLSRIFGHQYGSSVTFAAGVAPSASGQWSVTALRAVFAAIAAADAAR